jgi:hypothetical protein
MYTLCVYTEIFQELLQLFQGITHMIKFEVVKEDDLWRICDLLKQMHKKYKAIGMAVVTDDIREDERLSILYLVRCVCVQPTEYDITLYNAV